MGSDQISDIAPSIREALAGGSSCCATIERNGDQEKWVQFVDGTINAAYPKLDHPSTARLPHGDFTLQSWESGRFLTGKLDSDDPRTIARWIDAYFINILDCGEDYSIDCKIEVL